MHISFTGTIWYWKGPSPFYFVTVPEQQCHDLKAISGLVTYGWGMIPVTAQIGETTWKTSLFPKDGRYLVPLKDSVRKAAVVGDGDSITIQLAVR
jgi:hypothetical protein